MSFSTTGSVFAKRAPRKQAFSILICGADGTGKSSFINTLVGRRVLFESENQHLPAATNSTLRFKPITIEPEELLSDGSRLVLTLIETEGFGLNIEHAKDVEAVAEYIEFRFDEVLAEESRIRRNPRFKDNRVDVCLYFIEPTGHGLRELDVLTLKRLAGIVNLVPVLARSDTLTPGEVVANKRLISEDLRFHDIDVFDFQFSEDGRGATNDELSDLQDNELYNAMPFALSSTSEFGENGESLNQRVLSFGTVDILNPKHTDFKILKDAVLDGFLGEFKDRTHDILYETFRTHRLDPQQNHRASLLMPQELADHAARLKQAQIDRETALLREEERRVNAEIEAKRAMLLRRERELRELEQRMSETRISSGPISTSSSAPSSAPSSATSTRFPLEQIPESGQPRHVSSSSAGQPNPYAAAVEQALAQESVYSRPSQAAGGPDELQHAHSQDGADQRLRVRQSRSKKELREHTDQLQAELGNLEAQREDIQRQVASATSSKSLHTQLRGSFGSSNTSLSGGQHSASNAPSLPNHANDFEDVSNTSPLKIKKATAA